MSLQSIDIFGFRAGAQKKNKKPFLFVDDAFQQLENAYVWRDQVKKREGLQLVGRYRRVFDAASIGNSGASPWTISTLYSNYTPAITAEATAEIEPGSVVIVVGAITFTDQGNGLLTSPTGGNSGYIDYLTGTVVLTHTAGAGVASTASFAYFPGLPAMGILTRELAGINDEQTMWFDTKYCYINVGGDFQEFLPATGTTWDGTDSDFFWGANYRGSTADVRLFFVTNFALSGGLPSAGSPMRYTDAPASAVWTAFEPLVSATQSLFASRILIPYYGRLLAFNCWEGTTRATSVNIFNRCRFSQIGNPVQTTAGEEAWRSDIFGKGGFIDAPVNEEIISATFYKNTLIVFFERSTWRLQYLGEYGLPFIWERISSDYGSESTFSPVLFDSGVLAVGDKAIVGSSGGDVKRIDLDIPDEVYRFKNADEGVKRVHGIRDFKKEIVYWCYPDFPTFQLDGQFYPNKTLLYNYRNNTFAFFRNNVTCFGNFQYDSDTSWDRLDVFWDSYNVSWSSDNQVNMPLIVSGNQQGFSHFYGYDDVEPAADSTIDAMDQEGMSVTGVTAGATVSLTIKDHNLVNDEFIYLTGLNYVVTTSPATAGSTTLNDQIYLVRVDDANTVTIFKWDPNSVPPSAYSNFTYTNAGTYVGGGVVALFPRLEVQTKDFNPLKENGGFNIKTSYIDFLFDASSPSPISVLMQMNTTPNADANLKTSGNLLIGNSAVETANSKTGYISGATQANPCVITSVNHGLLDGDEISPMQVGGMTQLNGNQYTVTFISTDTFSIGVDSSAFTTYTSGGYWVQTLQQYYTLSSQYAWHRFYASCFGQYLSLILTYDNNQMSQLSTHQQNFVLNAMKIWYRPGGRNIFGK